MAYVKGPDFPTGVSSTDNGIIEAYSTGRGRLKVRARTSIEEHEGRKRIIVSEIPYQVNKSTCWRTSPSWSRTRRSRASPTSG